MDSVGDGRERRKQIADLLQDMQPADGAAAGASRHCRVRVHGDSNVVLVGDSVYYATPRPDPSARRAELERRLAAAIACRDAAHRRLTRNVWNFAKVPVALAYGPYLYVLLRSGSLQPSPEWVLGALMLLLTMTMVVAFGLDRTRTRCRLEYARHEDVVRKLNRELAVL